MPLDKNTPVSTWIKNFIKSVNPKFDGKSTEKRREMAIAAAMSKKNESEEGELVLIEELIDIDEEMMASSHPMYKAVSDSLGSHNKVHSIKVTGSANGGKHTNLEVRKVDPKNPNAVRKINVTVHNANNSVVKSKMDHNLTDVRHLNDSEEHELEENLVNHFAYTEMKPHTTKNLKHFNSMMDIRRVQHLASGNHRFTVEHDEKTPHIHVYTAHDEHGNKVAVGTWNNKKKEGMYLRADQHHESVVGKAIINILREGNWSRGS